MHKSARLRIKKRNCGRILRDGFRTGPWVASDAKCSLRPSEHAQRLSVVAPEEQVGFLARMKYRRFLHA